MTRPLQISDVRKRVIQRIEQARRQSSERRARIDAAEKQYAAFLSTIATPVFRMVANVLAAEGHPFKVFTPADSLRLMSGRSAQSFIELTLDTAADPPAIAGRTSRERGRRVIESERPLAQSRPIDGITEEDVLEFLLEELGPLVER
jgi:hypothetical protein